MDREKSLKRKKIRGITKKKIIIIKPTVDDRFSNSPYYVTIDVSNNRTTFWEMPLGYDGQAMVDSKKLSSKCSNFH